LRVDESLIGDGPLVVFGEKLEGLFYVEGELDLTEAGFAFELV
jgi:hypothetical protein